MAYLLLVPGQALSVPQLLVLFEPGVELVHPVQVVSPPVRVLPLRVLSLPLQASLFFMILDQTGDPTFSFKEYGICRYF